MFSLRYQVFRERMGWNVGFLAGDERDCYDLMSPIYAVALNERGTTVGCWRLMPTTGPYLLKDVFPHLLHDHPAPNDPRIWEASRFAVDTKECRLNSLCSLTEVTGSLMAALLELGLSVGLKKIVAVSDTRFERLLARGGLVTRRFGESVAIGNSHAVAGWFDVSLENLRSVQRANHLWSPVVVPAQELSYAA